MGQSYAVTASGSAARRRGRDRRLHGHVKARRDAERVTIDITVQPKAVTHLTDGKLIHRGVEILGRLARQHSVALRQSWPELTKRAAV